MTERPSDLPRLMNERADLQGELRALLAVIEDDEHIRRGFASEWEGANRAKAERLSAAIDSLSLDIGDLMPSTRRP
jgi:hypothetical protein